MELNIHLRLACPEAQEAAANVVDRLSREIDITSSRSPHIPHVTLLIGQFTGSDAEACIDRVAALLEREIGSQRGAV